MNFFSKAYDKVNGIFGGEQDPQTQQNNQKNPSNQTVPTTYRYSSGRQANIVANLNNVSETGNRPVNPPQKKSSLSKWAKWGAFGVSCSVLGGVLVATGPAILAGLGAAVSAIGGGFAAAATAGAVTIPLGGVGFGILGATAVAGLGYLAHKRYQHNFAKKSVFSHNDVKSFNFENPKKSGKLLTRTEENIGFGKTKGYGLFINQGKGKEAIENASHNVEPIKFLEAVEHSPQMQQLTTLDRTDNSFLRYQVSEMLLSDKLAYLSNHEFTKQLDNNRSTRNNLKNELGYDPFKKITSEGLNKIAALFEEKAIDLESHKCPFKAEVCDSLADAAKSVAIAIAQYEDMKKQEATLEPLDPTQDLDDGKSDTSSLDHELDQELDMDNDMDMEFTQADSKTPVPVKSIDRSTQTKVVQEPAVIQQQGENDVNIVKMALTENIKRALVSSPNLDNATRDIIKTDLAQTNTGFDSIESKLNPEQKEKMNTALKEIAKPLIKPIGLRSEIIKDIQSSLKISEPVKEAAPNSQEVPAKARTSGRQRG